MSSSNSSPHAEIVNQLAQLTQGLFFMSESDYPLEVIILDQIVDNNLTPELLELTQYTADTPVQEESLPYFFRNMTKDKADDDQETRVKAERFRLLQDFMEQQLQDVKVYRIGRREIKAFAVGKTIDNYYIGFKTILVET